MRINNNISAVVTNNQLLGTESSLSASMERLASGLKINHSKDNPAGMAIANKMKAQIDGLDQASQNASDGSSVLETADGALKEVTEMIQRMRELSIQAANGLNSDAERNAIQVEIESLKEEIDRIAETTEFNTKPLLDGTCDARVYAANCSRIQTSNYVSAGTYKFEVVTAASRAQIESDVTQIAAGADDWTGANAYVETETIYDKEANAYPGLPKTQIEGKIDTTVATGFVDFVNAGTYTKTTYTNTYNEATKTLEATSEAVTGTGLAAEGIVVINSVQVELKVGMTGEQVYMALRDGAEKANVKISDPDQPLAFTSKELGANHQLEIAIPNKYLARALGGGFVVSRDPAPTDPSDTSVVARAVGNDPEIEFVYNKDDETSLFGNQVTASFDGRKTSFTDVDGFEISLMLEDDFVGDIVLNVTEIGVMKFQIGANEGQTMDVRIGSTNCDSLYIDNLDVSTVRGADKAISQLDFALDKITKVRSQIGAYTNRLEHTVKSLDETEENMESAISRIQDVDMATEMVEYTKYNVLEQAGVSALSQANELPQLALQLLQ